MLQHAQLHTKRVSRSRTAGRRTQRLSHHVADARTSGSPDSLTAVAVTMCKLVTICVVAGDQMCQSQAVVSECPSDSIRLHDVILHSARALERIVHWMLFRKGRSLMEEPVLFFLTAGILSFALVLIEPPHPTRDAVVQTYQIALLLCLLLVSVST